MRAEDWLHRYRIALQGAANPLRAQAMAAYMRGQFVFYGVATPERRAITSPLQKRIVKELDEVAILALAAALWREPEREYQYAACDLLVAACKTLTPAALPILEQLVTMKSWWDTVDTLATRVIGTLVLREPALVARMEELSHHPDLWLRRVAILYQLHWKAKTDCARLLAICLRNSADPDFFIRKAIGWALRQYARTAPATVADWLVRYSFSPLTRREAGKHL